jgi:hypothetical protein
MVRKSLLQYFFLLLLFLLPGASRAQAQEFYQFINASSCDYNLPTNGLVLVGGWVLVGENATVYCAIPQPLTPTPQTGPLQLLDRVRYEGLNFSAQNQSAIVIAQVCIFISTARNVVVQCGIPHVSDQPGRFSDVAIAPVNDEATGAYIAFTFTPTNLNTFLYQAQAFWTRP